MPISVSEILFVLVGKTVNLTKSIFKIRSFVDLSTKSYAIRIVFKNPIAPFFRNSESKMISDANFSKDIFHWVVDSLNFAARFRFSKYIYIYIYRKRHVLIVRTFHDGQLGRKNPPILIGRSTFYQKTNPRLYFYPRNYSWGYYLINRLDLGWE